MALTSAVTNLGYWQTNPTWFHQGGHAQGIERMCAVAASLYSIAAFDAVLAGIAIDSARSCVLAAKLICLEGARKSRIGRNRAARGAALISPGTALAFTESQERTVPPTIARQGLGDGET
jgi:hypothetical protein